MRIIVTFFKPVDHFCYMCLLSHLSVPPQKCTTYSGGYSAEEPVIKNFWKVIEGTLHVHCAACFFVFRSLSGASHSSCLPCVPSLLYCVAPQLRYYRLTPYLPFFAGMSPEDQTLFLRFVSGRSRLPLTAADFPRNFQIDRMWCAMYLALSCFLVLLSLCFFLSLALSVCPYYLFPSAMLTFIL